MTMAKGEKIITPPTKKAIKPVNKGMIHKSLFILTFFNFNISENKAFII